jgi:hypothetical protein
MSTFDESPDGMRDEPLTRDPAGQTATMRPAGAHQPMYDQPSLHQQHFQQHQYQQPHYPSQPMPPYGYGQQWELRPPRRVHPIETKPFFLTSEFVAAVLAVAGIAITAASSEAFGAWRAWILITGVTAAYLISRGIAKSGTRSHSDDPREHLNLDWGRNRD